LRYRAACDIPTSQVSLKSLLNFLSRAQTTKWS